MNTTEDSGGRSVQQIVASPPLWEYQAGSHPGLNVEIQAICQRFQKRVAERVGYELGLRVALEISCQYFLPLPRRYPVRSNLSTSRATPNWGRGNALDLFEYFSGKWWAHQGSNLGPAD